MSDARPPRRHLPCLLGLLMLWLTGCSNFAVFQGIPAVPAHRVPPQVLSPPRSEMIEISMSRLRQTPPDVYQLGAGDVLGVYIETVLGNPEEPPPVHFPEDGSRQPALGYPVPIREDGTVALPLVPPISVEGLTLAQATEEIQRAYTVDRQILPEGSDRVIVTLMRKREHRVLVVREESGGQEGVTKRGAGFTVDLPAYENDLLHALNETGGLPGLDAKNEILIYRGVFEDAAERDQLVAGIRVGSDPCLGPIPVPEDPHLTHIPIRYFPEQLPYFTEEDIILNTGDIVMIKARDSEIFYTGGVIPGGEFLLPRDYDLDILGAIALSGGPIGSGGTGLSQVGGRGMGGGGMGMGRGGGAGIAPSRAIVLRKLPGGDQIPIRVNLHQALIDPRQRILIQPGDVIIVQFTLLEELYNAALNMMRFNFLFSGFSGRGI